MSVTSVQFFKTLMQHCGTMPARFLRCVVADIVMSIASMDRTDGKNLIGTCGNRKHRN